MITVSNLWLEKVMADGCIYRTEKWDFPSNPSMSSPYFPLQVLNAVNAVGEGLLTSSFPLSFQSILSRSGKDTSSRQTA